MTKFLIVALALVTVGCSKGDKANSQKGSEADRWLIKLYNEQGRPATQADLTASAWCEIGEEGASQHENMKFTEAGKIFVNTWVKGTDGRYTMSEKYSMDYQLSNGSLTVVTDGELFTSKVMIASAEEFNGHTHILINDSGETIEYSKCDSSVSE